jgi:hypothetical protein
MFVPHRHTKFRMHDTPIHYMKPEVQTNPSQCLNNVSHTSQNKKYLQDFYIFKSTLRAPYTLS